MSGMHKIDKDVLSVLQSQVTIRDVTDVIKELLENSIDSGATEITLKFKAKDFYQVWCKDNGDGFTPSDLEIVGMRSHTSKLNKLLDLRQLDTFGFRGEALHSIINVCSRVDIVSRSKEYRGKFKISFDKGHKIKEVEMVDEVEIPKNGTLIVTSNIFGTIPVRLKHLEKISELSILKKIRQIVFAISIAHPSVSIKIFKLNEANKENLIIYTGESSKKDIGMTFADTLRAVYGVSIMGHYESFQLQYENYQLQGIIGLKAVHDKSYQSIFINNRLLVNVSILKDINDQFSMTEFGNQDEIVMPNFASSELSPKKGKSPTKIVGKPFIKYPIFIFDIKCPQSVSDLIQDPSKVIYETKHLEIVKILISKVLHNFFKAHGYKPDDHLLLDQRILNFQEAIPLKKRALMKLLVNSKSKISKISENELKGRIASNEGHHCHPRINFKELNFAPKKQCVHASDGNDIHKINLQEEKSIFFPGVSNIQLSLKDLNQFSVIGQVDKKFILVKLLKQNSGPLLVVIDQHACDERIKVEHHLKNFIERTMLCPREDQDVAFTLTDTMQITMSDVELDMLKEYYLSFEVWGIRYNINRNNVEITHLPTILASKIGKDLQFIKNVLLQHCTDLQSHAKLTVSPNTKCQDWWSLMQYLPRVIITLYNSKACRSAIMFGDLLTNEQCREYISKLKGCKLPFQCAHGRPSVVPLIDLNTI